MKNRRTYVLAPLGAVAVVLAFASLAYACTTIVGSITTTPASGSTVSVGDPITATGSNLHQGSGPDAGKTGAQDGTWWGLYFLRYESNADSMDICMGNLVAGEQKMGQESKKQANNSVTITGPIPGPRLVEPEGSGNARVCLVSERAVADVPTGQPNYRWGTPSSEFVIAGGS